jgi:bifunctional DNA-binding transcriptional regulator/antitoxin component of YhaV-PrlF toxin-antitoxin module
MFREFDITVDDQGNLHMPEDVRQRHGLQNGARVRAEDRPNGIVFKETGNGSAVAAKQKAAIRSIVGLVPPDSKIIEHYLEEKRNDREREDRSSRL